MAEDYTPATDEITRYYIDGSRDWFPGLTASERNERFDRWLAEVRREAAEKAWDEGRKAEELSWKHVFDGHPVPEGEKCDECAVVNPYRAPLAGSGEQPGETTTGEGVGTGAGEGAPRQDTGSAWVTRSVDCPEAPAQAHPAPVAPDSADVREQMLHVLDSHGIDTYIDGTGAEVGIRNLITDLLAVVGQGVTAEQAWDEGYKAGCHDSAEDEQRFQMRDWWSDLPATKNPYREETGDDR